MKKWLSLCVSMLALTAGAEEWSAGFNAPANTGGRTLYFKIVLDLPTLQDGPFTGQVLKVYGATTCRYPVPLKGTVAGDEVRFTSELNEIKGCGRIVFNGKKIGDALEGVVPFQGIQAQVAFKK
jgi:hypothetical protein